MGRMAWGLYRATRRVLLPGLSEDDRAEMDELIAARVHAAGGRRAGAVIVWARELLDLISAWRTRWRVPKLGVSLLDVKLGLRMLVKHPGLTAVAVFALAIGIPVGLAPWHLVNAIEAPLPVNEGNRIQVLRYWNEATNRQDATRLDDFVRWRDALNGFEALGAARPGVYNVNSEDGLVPPVRGAEVTASTFDILRVPPLYGRTIVAADEVPGAPDVVVIGYDLWRSRLGADPDIVGASLRIGRVAHTVVGVMPEGFFFPARDELWLPLREQLADEPFPGTSADHLRTPIGWCLCRGSADRARRRRSPHGG